MEWTVRKWLGGCHAGAEAAGTRLWEVEWDRSVASRTHRRQGETPQNALVQLLTIVNLPGEAKFGATRSGCHSVTSPKLCVLPMAELRGSLPVSGQK